MKLNLLRRRAFAIAATAFFTSAVLGQAPGTGAIKGTVYDPSGAVVQNARVTVASEATRVPDDWVQQTRPVHSVFLCLLPARIR